MMTKIEQGGTAYDIAVPSEYTIEKMKEEDLLHANRSFETSESEKY